jgi:hypothetical protein
MAARILLTNLQRRARDIGRDQSRTGSQASDRHGNAAGSGADIDNSRLLRWSNASKYFSNEQFGFGPRNEHGRCDGKLNPAKLLRPEDVLERFARSAPRDESLHPGEFVPGERSFAVDDLRKTRKTEHKLDQPDSFLLAGLNPSRC